MVIKEDFLHFVWKHQVFKTLQLKTTSGEDIQVVFPGIFNTNAGPDFLQAKVYIAGVLWVGHVEMHLKATSWYRHGHENDPNYKNVILHVVWEADCEVYASGKAPIPTIQLQPYISQNLLSRYQELVNQPVSFINCEKGCISVDTFVWENWLEKLYIERLEVKYTSIENQLKATQNNWEAILFSMLMKNFGLKVNAHPFESIAQNLPFSVVRKLNGNQTALEALFFGLASLLEPTIEDAYFETLKKEYNYLKNKFGLSQEFVKPVQFFRLRPANFPTIRLSQLASLYANNNALFSELMNTETLEGYYRIFHVKASAYWESHYNFGKKSNPQPKQLTKSFVHLLLINTVVPLKFAYLRHQGSFETDGILTLVKNIPPETNAVLKSYKKLGLPVENALTSQAFLQLSNSYCTKNKCLQCDVGNALLRK